MNNTTDRSQLFVFVLATLSLAGYVFLVYTGHNADMLVGAFVTLAGVLGGVALPHLHNLINSLRGPNETPGPDPDPVAPPDAGGLPDSP